MLTISELKGESHSYLYTPRITENEDHYTNKYKYSYLCVNPEGAWLFIARSRASKWCLDVDVDFPILNNTHSTK